MHNPTQKSSWPLESEGVWIETRMPRHVAPRAALFLDRDGVVIEDRGFVADARDVALVPGVASLIALANAARIPVCVVSNQSGIDRGRFGWGEFAAVTRRIDEALASAGAHIDAIAACPFHPDHTKSYDDAHARWRKPGPQMILALSERLNLDRARSFLVGDQDTDIQAAQAAGLGRAILVHEAGGLDAARAAIEGLSRP